MLLHERHRAGQQGYTAEADSTQDAESAVEIESNCSLPLLQGLEANTRGHGCAGTNTDWVPHPDHQT